MYNNDVYDRWQTRGKRKNWIVGTAFAIGGTAVLSLLGIFVYVCIQGLV